MNQTTETTARVLPGRTADEWLLLEVDTADPTYVERPDLDGDPDSGDDADRNGPGLEHGNRIEATLEWDDGEPRLASWTVLEPTRFRFRRTDAPVFQAAQHCFEEARRAGEAMNARVIHDTDGRPNGVVYTFADQPGQRDLYAEFRDGEKPLEPLLDRAAESTEAPFSVWVLDVSEPFVLVTIVLDPDGLLEGKMREAYGDAG
ncbi:DUF6663 family protein [Saliphagus sp. GCM10025317]